MLLDNNSTGGASQGAPPFLEVMITTEKQTGIYFKLTDQQRRQLEARMEQAGVSNMSAFIRKMCLNGYIIRLDLPELPACSKYLSAASNNLNQIARRVTAGGNCYPEELQEVKASYDRCSQLFGKVLDSMAVLDG